MENVTDRIVTVSAELTAIEENKVEDTTAEAPPVLGTVFRSIFVEVPKDFFASIGNFFKRYFVHFKTVFRYFGRPSLRTTPFNKINFSDHTQHSFEIALLLVAALLFMIKQDWIPADESLKEVYGNDIMEMLMQFFIFVLMALAFFAQLVLSVVCGRIYRALFKVPITKKQTDILFCFLSNSIFSLSALLAFLMRLGGQYEQIRGTDTENSIFVICFGLCFLLVSWWSLRFAKWNGVAGGKKVLFILTAIPLLTILYGAGMTAICFFILGA